MQSENELLDFNDRYGIKPARSWVKYAAAIALAGAVWIIWAGLHHAQPALSSTLISFENSDPRNPSIRFSITRGDGGDVVICTLTARDFDKNVVGQIDDRIEAGEKFVERTVIVPTRADAVNVGISQCRLLNS